MRSPEARCAKTLLSFFTLASSSLNVHRKSCSLSEDLARYSSTHGALSVLATIITAHRGWPHLDPEYLRLKKSWGSWLCTCCDNARYVVDSRPSNLGVSASSVPGCAKVCDDRTPDADLPRENSGVLPQNLGNYIDLLTGTNQLASTCSWACGSGEAKFHLLSLGTSIARFWAVGCSR